jgi:hypothetical protein
VLCAEKKRKMLCAEKKRKMLCAEKKFIYKNQIKIKIDKLI